MSFDLRIHFIGLAMYVPEGNEKMHVLLPSTRHAHGPTPPGGVHGHDRGHDHGGAATLDAAGGGPEAPTGVDEGGPGAPTGVDEGGEEPGTARGPGGELDAHFARIVYDTAYEHPGQAQLARKYKFVDLEGRVLDLSGLQAEKDLDEPLPDELASLDGVAEPVPPELVRNAPDHRLAARVTMGAGALTDYTIGAHFTLGNSGPARRMTTRTEWTIRGIQGDFLPEQELAGADGRPTLTLPRLVPIGKTIHLMVFDTVASEFPPGGDFRVVRLPPDTGTPHFVAYHAVCRPRVGDLVPQAASVPDAVQVEEGSDLVGDGPAVPSMTCVQTQAPLG